MGKSPLRRWENAEIGQRKTRKHLLLGDHRRVGTISIECGVTMCLNLSQLSFPHLLTGPRKNPTPYVHTLLSAPSKGHYFLFFCLLSFLQPHKGLFPIGLHTAATLPSSSLPLIGQLPWPDPGINQGTSKLPPQWVVSILGYPNWGFPLSSSVVRQMPRCN
jgi:hypothetical protein